MPEHHRVLFAASEATGFAKTGGLADVIAALPVALAGRGHECAVILPAYRSVFGSGRTITDTGQDLEVPVGDRKVKGRLYRSHLPGGRVPVYLIRQPDYFERDDPALGRSYYQYALENGQRADYPDNCERFVFFDRAILEAISFMDWPPGIIHANDWQSGLVPVYLHELYRGRRELADVRTVFTIHNIAYQGMFWHWDMHLTGLDWRLFNHRQLEFYGHLNFLKAGIVFSNRITTVSPTYAREIQTPEYGAGLEGVLRERRDDLHGIVNGIDEAVWNPATDPHLAERYDVDTVVKGKAACKLALERHFGLPAKPRVPLIGMVSRLVEQKGLDLLARVGELILREDVQMVFLGEGDPAYHRLLKDLRDRYPNQVALKLGFDEPLAHQIEGGADLFLMPSRYEPSGLNQLYSLKYGTVPIVRATGGLADTVTDCNPASLETGTATGFCFQQYTPHDFLMCVRRAIAFYQNQPERWLPLVQNGMRQDWSWNRSAKEYERIYDELRG
jgi:starch synthase